MTCKKEKDIPSFEITMVELRDDGRYEFTCSYGHTSTVLLQQQKFELLFDIGAYAILDGYYREAVSSFTSSLERFYEFVIKLSCAFYEMSDESYTECWKQVSNQSERQLGAYIFLWGIQFENLPPLLKNKDVSFRNSVIHKGKIPTKNEALSYGSKVYDLIASGLAQIRAKPLEDSITNIVFNHISETRGDTDAENVSFMCVRTIISLSNSPDEHYNKSFEEHLTEIDEWRHILNSSRVTKP